MQGHSVYFHNFNFDINSINEDKFFRVSGTSAQKYPEMGITIAYSFQVTFDSFFLSVSNSWKFLGQKLFTQGVNILSIIEEAKLFIILKRSAIKTWIFHWWFLVLILLPSISGNVLILSSKTILSERSYSYFIMLLGVLEQNLKISRQ